MKYYVSMATGYFDDNPKESERVDSYEKAQDIFSEWLDNALSYEVEHSPYMWEEWEYEKAREDIARHMFINEEEK